MCYYNTSLHSSDNPCCLHISFSFCICRGRRPRRPAKTFPSSHDGLSWAPAPTIILQITLLVSVNQRRLYRNKIKMNLHFLKRKSRFIFFGILRQRTPGDGCPYREGRWVVPGDCHRPGGPRNDRLVGKLLGDGGTAHSPFPTGSYLVSCIHVWLTFSW